MSKYEELSKLKELLDAGILSQDEFDVEKKKILDAPEEVKPSPTTPTKKPGFFSKEAIRQRQEAFDKLSESEKRQQQMVGLGACGVIAIVFAIFACMIMFIAMLLGWDGVRLGIENLWGL